MGEHMYMINIGGKDNTYTALRKGIVGEDAVSAETADVLDMDVSTRFRVSFDFGTGEIILKKWVGFAWKELLAWTDEEPIEVNYLAISAGEGKGAHWWFDF
jgi:hypothetical protein